VSAYVGSSKNLKDLKVAGSCSGRQLWCLAPRLRGLEPATGVTRIEGHTIEGHAVD